MANAERRSDLAALAVTSKVQVVFKDGELDLGRVDSASSKVLLTVAKECQVAQECYARGDY